MAGIVDGQGVNAANSNAAWLAKNGNDTAVGIIGLSNTDPASGDSIANLQGKVNEAADAADSAVADLATHTANQAAHGAVSTATASKIMTRDGAGKVQAVTFEGDLDVHTNGATLNIGATNAGTINIGTPSTIVNIQGTVNNVNTTNTEVTDQLITLNNGGLAATGGGTGFEIEENNVITGYVKTSASRNGFEFKAPNTAGIATLTPGTSADNVVLAAASQTLTNKTLTAPAISSPTGLVKGDVGLGNVDNTSDASKNAAAVTLTNKTLTAPVINSPTGLVKADVGLGNVDNTSDATKNAASVTLTNKTIAAGSNTITGIANANVDAAAAIARSKLAAGTAYGAVVNDSSGVMTSVAPGTSGNVLKSNGTSWVSDTVSAPGTTTSILVDEKASGTDGGGASATTWNTRTLNTAKLDQISVSLSSNQFTLTAGTYIIRASAPAFEVNSSLLRLWNVTDSSAAIYGQNSYAGSATVAVISAHLVGTLTLAGSKTFRLEHYTAAAKAGSGLGVAQGIGVVETYAMIEIVKVS